jgi:predicted DNA-binding transcriptional regulator AlpA
MELIQEIAQVKKINGELLELLDRLIRKQVELEARQRKLDQMQQLSERAKSAAQQSRAQENNQRLWVRVFDICRSAKNPNSLLPISPSSWYIGVKEARFPRPRKMGRMSTWRLEDIKHLAQSASVVDD